jgi:SAM-dependent MidA family methyltransferase
MDSNSALYKTIIRYIDLTPKKQITFAQYMDMVLYHPEFGYYSTQAAKLGKKGDFFTSVHLGADFGEMLAVQFVQMWKILGQPKSFTLVEMGAGQGFLARDVLKYIQQNYLDFFTNLNYIIVEKSPVLRQLQQQHLQEFSISWCNLEDIKSDSITGCFFSNELVDAFPVHQFVIKNRQLQEIYITTPGEEVVDEPSTAKLREYFDFVGVDITQDIYPEGYRSEVNLAALDWLTLVAKCLQRGYVLTIDYGYTANRYYNPRRGDGTLQCYYQHHRHNNPYINIGQQDITTHVNFTALEEWGLRCDLNKLGFTQQGLFLMALGLGERIAALSQQKSIAQLLHRRDTLHQLIDPMGVGGFGVLAQSKGLTNSEVSQNLKGFVVAQ